MSESKQGETAPVTQDAVSVEGHAAEFVRTAVAEGAEAFREGLRRTPSRGGRDQGASFGPGHPSLTEPAGGLCPPGGYPSRMQWRTIETAPRDGTLFLVWAAPGQHDLPAMYSLCSWHELAGFCIDELRQPTCWMPLPPAPGMEAEGRNPQGSGAEHDSPIGGAEASQSLSPPEAPQTGIQEAREALQRIADYGTVSGMHDQDRAPKLQDIARKALQAIQSESPVAESEAPASLDQVPPPSQEKSEGRSDA